MNYNQHISDIFDINTDKYEIIKNDDNIIVIKFINNLKTISIKIYMMILLKINMLKNLEMLLILIKIKLKKLKIKILK